MKPIIESATFVKGITKDDPILYDKKPIVCFIGRSNVGKSSLINALVNKKDLVKVSPTPGKTREANFFLINKSLYFVDLPGYGYARASNTEREQITTLIRSFVTASYFSPSVVVLVIDARVGMTDFDIEMLELLRSRGLHIAIAANKIDVLNQKEKSAQMKAIGFNTVGSELFQTSTKTKAGIEALCEHIITF